jgi:8-oxo-dGTP diphosphatase
VGHNYIHAAILTALSGIGGKYWGKIQSMNSNGFRYTLCFITRGDDVLMLHRRNPPNQGLWNGVGGRLEAGETPRACILREIREETGFFVDAVRFAGVLTWEGFEIPSGGLYIFTGAVAPGMEPHPCSEGELEWKPRAWVLSAPEVVSNIHRFGAEVLDGQPPRVHHFVYQNGELVQYQASALWPDLIVG